MTFTGRATTHFHEVTSRSLRKHPGRVALILHSQQRTALPSQPTRSITMWTKPAASDLRFGFEVTMYIAAR